MPADAPAAIRYFRAPHAGVEAMSASTARAFARHTHDLYGIGIVDAGGHSSWSGRGQVEAGPGTFISVNPGEVHDGAAVGGQPRAWRILYFEPSTLAALRDDISEGDATEFHFASPAFADRGLCAAFESAWSRTHDAAGAEVDAAGECEAALLSLVARLEPQAAARGVRRTSQSMPDVRRARARIDADPAAPVTLHELARDAGISRYQLIRAFRRDVGLTPHAYVLQRRLALARRLLLAGDSLPEVAAIAGFFDQSHFGRCFARQFGVPPGRYAISS